MTSRLDSFFNRVIDGGEHGRSARHGKTPDSVVAKAERGERAVGFDHGRSTEEVCMTSTSRAISQEIEHCAPIRAWCTYTRNRSRSTPGQQSREQRVEDKDRYADSLEGSKNEDERTWIGVGVTTRSMSPPPHHRPRSRPSNRSALYNDESVRLSDEAGPSGRRGRSDGRRLFPGEVPPSPEAVRVERCQFAKLCTSPGGDIPTDQPFERGAARSCTGRKFRQVCFYLNFTRLVYETNVHVLLVTR